MTALASFRNRLSALTVGVAISVLAVPNAIAGIIPVAADWSVAVSTIISRASGASNTSVTDVAGGVVLHFDAPTGGSGIGTATRRYDYTTTAVASGGTVVLDVDLVYDVFLGFASEDYGLQIMKNGAVLYNLIPDTFGANPVSILASFPSISINLLTGDTWGVRTMAGNFTACCGVSGNITLTQQVAEPATLGLLGLALAGFGVARRRKA